MTQYLIYSDGSSNKFWSISTEGSSYTVVFGKVGTAGQTQTKCFASSEEAEAAANKQAAAKMKKGYEPAEPPKEAPVPKAKASAPKAAPKKAAPAAPANGPAPVKDDGKLKPWHQEDSGIWRYDFNLPEEEEFTIEALTNPVELYADAQAQPAAVPETVKTAKQPTKEQLCWDGDDDDDDDNDRRANDSFSIHGFGWDCQKHPLEEIQATFEKAAKDGVEERILRLGLNDGIDRILTYSLYENGRKNLPWLLEKGGTLKDEDDIDEVYAKHFWEAYTQSGDPYKAAESLEAFLDKAYGQIAAKLAQGLQAVAKAVGTRTLEEKSGVTRLPSKEEMEWCTGFRLAVDDDRYTIYTEGKDPAGNRVFSGTCEATDDVDASVAAQFMPGKLRPLVEKMGQEGAFDNLGIPSVSITYRDVVLFHKVLDADGLEQQKQKAEALVQKLETTTDFEEGAKLLRDAIHFLLKGPLQQDVPRLADIFWRLLHSLNEEAETSAHILLCHNADKYPQLKYIQALWHQEEGHYKSAYDGMAEAMRMGHEGAAEKHREYEELARQRALKVKRPAKKKEKATEGREVAFTDFTEQDLFIDTENIIARAYQSGIIRIRFKIEGEEGYGEALDYLNNLLEKGYSRIDSGFTLLVRLLAKPQFIKGLPDFPQNSCHAFFTKAVQYPALREKVRHYADLALVEYDWYGDLDGEENTVTGTFAACALAFCDESYIPLVGKFARICDGSHQEIQLQVAAPLAKRHGAVPEVAKAVFDICASNEHDAPMSRLPKELCTLPENLNAIMEHIEGDAYSQQRLEWRVSGCIEQMMGSSKVKNNLKKLKTLWQAAANDADKKVYEDFYNLYKGYATAKYEEDYGEDLVSAPRGDVQLPTYHENPPVVTSLKDFEKQCPDTKIEWEYPAERRTVLFIPPAIVNPYLLDYMFKQWDALCRMAREMPSSFFWTHGATRMGDWVVNLYGPAKECGVILCNGKNAPIVLYGVLNLVPLFTRFHKRPFKSREDAELARLANLIEEAADYVPIPPEEAKVYECCADACSALMNNRRYAAGVLLARLTPKNGKVYDAALLLRARLAKQMLDFDGERAVYEELAERLPEYTEYWQEKIEQLG